MERPLMKLYMVEPLKAATLWKRPPNENGHCTTDCVHSSGSIVSIWQVVENTKTNTSHNRQILNDAGLDKYVDIQPALALFTQAPMAIGLI